MGPISMLRKCFCAGGVKKNLPDHLDQGGCAVMEIRYSKGFMS